MSKRFIPCKMLINKEGKFIPFWELLYSKDDYYGERFNEKESRNTISDLADCYYDMKKHTLVTGKIIDRYPNPIFKIGSKVVFTARNFRSDHKAEIRFIKEISFLDYEPYVKKIKNDDLKNQYYRDYPDIVKGDIVEIREWKITYILDDDTKIRSEYELFLLEEENDKNTNDE